MLKSCMVKFLSSGGKSRFHTSSMVEMSADWPGDSSMPGMHLLGEGHMGIFSLWIGWGFGSEGPSLLALSMWGSLRNRVNPGREGYRPSLHA